jgi:hypothetical protein
MSYIHSPHHDPEDRLRTDLNYDDAIVLEPAKFCECECWSYCLGCSFSIVLLLGVSAVFLLFAPPLGLLIAAFTPGYYIYTYSQLQHYDDIIAGVVILLLSKRYYKSQVTNGQMTGDSLNITLLLP